MVVLFMDSYGNNLDILFVIRTRTINSIPSIPDYRQAVEIDLPIICSKNSMYNILFYLFLIEMDIRNTYIYLR